MQSHSENVNGFWSFCSQLLSSSVAALNKLIWKNIWHPTMVMSQSALLLFCCQYLFSLTFNKILLLSESDSMKFHWDLIVVGSALLVLRFRTTYFYSFSEFVDLRRIPALSCFSALLRSLCAPQSLIARRAAALVNQLTCMSGNNELLCAFMCFHVGIVHTLPMVLCVWSVWHT